MEKPKKISDKKKPTWHIIENHPVKAQLVSNFISSVLTLAVLVATIIFSLNSLKETRKQYNLAKGQLDNATQQLALAKQQFDDSRRQRKIDLDSVVVRNKRIRKKEIIDSINQSKKDFQQQTRSKFQDSINSRQLSAIQLQAKTAKDQYDSQKLAFQQQLDENRAILMLTGVRLDSARSTIYPDATFTLMNVGKRPAVISKTKTIAWNELEPYFQPGVSVAKEEVNQNNAIFVSVRISHHAFEDKRTIYYVKIFYTDTQDNSLKYQILVFTLNSNPGKQFDTLSLLPSVEQRFFKYIKSVESYSGQWTE